MNSVDLATVQLSLNPVGPGVIVDMEWFATNTNDFFVTAKFQLLGDNSNGVSTQYFFEMAIRSHDTVSIGLVDPNFASKRPIPLRNAQFSVVEVRR